MDEYLDQEERWQALLEKHPEANFLQGQPWAKMNDSIGHRVVVDTFDDLKKDALAVMIIKDAKRGRYLEIPGGPLLNWGDEELLNQVFSRIVETAKHYNCVFIRFRPQLEKTDENEKVISSLKKSFDLRPAPMHLHAQNTVIIDLKKSEDELLADMRRQTRYEVRRGEKLGLKVIEDSGPESFEKFHKVQLETAKRQNFIPPSRKELLAERNAFLPNGIKLYVVKTDKGEDVAYGLILIFGREAEYFEAASTGLNRKLPGSTALLWQAMKDLKKLGLERFNLWGIAPPGATNHRYSGVTTFKTGFGGRVVEFIPAQDIVINKMRYKLDEIVENARKKKRNL